ncbi:MAG: hypothetical protein AB8B94_19520 [Hyphomicrobiales bacterium]
MTETSTRKNKHSLDLLMIVDDAAIASYVSERGVDKLFVDLETLGKEERQGHLDTVRSVQTPETLTTIREAVPDAHVLVRVNPLHQNSLAEIDDVVARGADSVMLPMFRDADALARFLDYLGGRAIPLPLFETQGSLDSLGAILQRGGFKTAHIGLNDLHIDRGDSFILEPLVDKVLDEPCRAFQEAGVDFGIGGIARAGEGAVPPELLLAEHVRLGSSAAILSRSFHRQASSLDELAKMDFFSEVAKIHDVYSSISSLSNEALVELCGQVLQSINCVIRSKK